MTPSVAHLPLLGVMGGFRRFSIPEYHHLDELGILTEDDNLELLKGYLVHKMTRNAPTTELCTASFGSSPEWCLMDGRFAVRLR